MSLRTHQVHYSYTEYLAFEAASNCKHEYADGLLGGRCRVLDADLRVRVQATGLTTYPDVSVVCGPRERSLEDEHAVTNPVVIVEVLSPSSDAYDRGEKFEHYRQLESLRHYVLVAQSERRIEVCSRGADDAWTSTTHGDGDAVELGAIAARLDVRAVYDAAAEPTA